MLAALPPEAGMPVRVQTHANVVLGATKLKQKAKAAKEKRANSQSSNSTRKSKPSKVITLHRRSDTHERCQPDAADVFSRPMTSTAPGVVAGTRLPSPTPSRQPLHAALSPHSPILPSPKLPGAGAMPHTFPCFTCLWLPLFPACLSRACFLLRS